MNLEKINFKGWENCLKLSNGEAELVISVGLGPRILSYRRVNGVNFMKNFDEEMADYFVAEVENFLDRQSSEKPFFLYYGLHQPHVPRAPHARFVGKTDLGPRGDAVVEADWCVGEVIARLEEKGLLENTLVIFTSDNGPVINDGYYDDAEERLGDHDPKAGTRGGKYSLFGITHSGGIGQQIDPGQAQMFEHIVLRIIQFDPFQCNCHQLAAACCDSLRHHLRRRELARPDKQTGAKLFVSNY